MLFLGCFSTAHADPVEITEWKVPWDNTRPRDPFVGPQGRVWFCGQKGGYLAYLDPVSGNFKKYELGRGAGPHNLIVDQNGFVWFAGNRNGYIGKLDPNSGDIVRYPIPDKEASDPHTLVFDSQGDIWFTVQQGNFVGKLMTETGEVKLVKVTTPHARPYGIVMDSKDRPWIALFGTNKLATVNPETFVLKEYELPNPASRPRRLAITSDKKIWYVDYSEGLLGSFDPKTLKFQQRPLPAGENAYPYAMAVDDQDNLWMVETGEMPNRLIGFNPSSGKFFSTTEIPSGAGSVRHMVFHKPTRKLWFGADTNTIGRAKIQ
ncbi:MAG: lyase [Nitrospina sp.]|nr:lyase [Nitrospina sp.]MBT5633694.1 lyase [Nitrospina sp.]